MSIKWVTSTMARYAAGLGEKEALESTIQKWSNYVHCTQEEYDVRAVELRTSDPESPTDVQSCALCCFRRNLAGPASRTCEECLLCIHTKLGCSDPGSLYQLAEVPLKVYALKPASETFELFQTLAGLLHQALVGCRKEMSSETNRHG